MAIMGTAIMAIMVFPQLWDLFFIFIFFNNPVQIVSWVKDLMTKAYLLVLPSRGYGSWQYRIWGADHVSGAQYSFSK